MKKVIIDAYRGGDDIGSNANGIVEKDYNLQISKYIYDRLRALGIPTSLTRESDETISLDNRISKIKSTYGTGNDVIVISNALMTGGDGAEIVYGLRNSSGLSEILARELGTAGVEVNKYYQRRLPSDTALDYNQLIRDTKNNESLIIYYGSIDNEEEAYKLKNNKEEVGEAVVIALANYLGVDYVPITGSNYYIVKKGDSLYSIARDNNTTVSEIFELNNLSSNTLSIGQILKLPSSNISNNKNTYVVKSGDTLYGIAKKYNTSVDELKKLNNLSSNTLSIGQVLLLASDSTSLEESGDNNTYIVKAGDTLYSIAKKYNISVDKLKSLNNLSSNILSIGQTLKIPIMEEENTYIVYTVVKGDNLYNIARIYNTSVSEIKKLNNLTTDILSIGQELKIPSNKVLEDVDYNTYKVVSGDSLYSIAKKYNTTVNTLKELNGLSSNLLSIGQVLKVPKL